MLFGWLSADTRDTAAVLESMAAALRVNAAEKSPSGRPAWWASVCSNVPSRTRHSPETLHAAQMDPACG